MLRSLLRIARHTRDVMMLPPAAKAERRLDRRGLLPDSDPDRVIEEVLQWMCRAQDNSFTQDGGVARHFSLISGWGGVVSRDDRIHSTNHDRLLSPVQRAGVSTQSKKHSRLAGIDPDG